MSHQIQFQPSGRRFTAEPGDTLLEAALRAGLNPAYSCNNGSCGECAARVLAGDAGHSLHHDYVMRPDPEGLPRVLLCRTRPRSDMVLEVAEADSLYDLPFQTIETRVYRNDAVTDAVRILQLRTPRSKTLQFLAGQYVTLHGEGLEPRNKSIASCPCNGMYLHFHVRHQPGDAFSDFVFEACPPKQKIMISGPSGHFTLDDRSSRPILFIANDTGFAPIKSLIEHAIALELEQPLALYWITARDEDHYLANQCRAWADALDNFRYLPLSLGPTDDPAQRLATLGEHIASHWPQLDSHDVYLNGPPEQAALLQARLLALGLPEDRLFIDELKRY